MPEVITNNLDLWSSALLTRSTAGRGSNGKLEAYGIRKLRALIMELAVRGKLVPQDPSDEPASELLKRIQFEKAQLFAEGKIKKDQPLVLIAEDEKPFELPQGWDWVRLGQISEANTGYAFKSTEYISEGTLVLRVTNIKPDGTLDLTDTKFIDPIEANSTYKNFQLSEDDVLLVMVGGSLGKLGVVDKNCLPAVLNQNMWKMARFGGITKDFFMFGLRQINSSQIEVTHSTHGHLAQGEYFSKLFPLPPLAEQHRIVVKVDELMALCDQLEQQQTHSIAAHQTLVASLLDTLTRVESQQEFSAAWARIASHFDTLFTTEASIDQLKQTILQLAVMGKLVPQDPDDEPASDLLQRISAEKTQLVSEGKVGNTKPLPPVIEGEKQFDIPGSWMWTRFDDLALRSEAGWSPSCEPTPRQGDNWGVLKVSAVTWGKYDPEKNKALPSNLEPKPEFEVMPGDFLISRANTAELVARAVVVPNGAPPRLMMSDKIIRFVFAPELNHEYLTLVNGSECSRAYYARVAGGTSSSMKNVSREQIRNLVVALPPLAEQHRIVAKVDELMALCDTLKARLAAAQAIQIYLADTIVEQAVA